MDLLQLSYFKTIAEQEHITKSANILMVSQPYLSAVIGRLESELGTELFKREGRRIVLNEYGKILLHHTNEIMRHLSDAKKEIEDMRSSDTKHIRVCSNTTVLLKGWLVDFLRKYPDIRISQNVVAKSQMLELLLQGKYDFALTVERIDHPKIISWPLWEDEYMVLVGEKHPFADRDGVYLEELKNEVFCALPPEANSWRIIDYIFKDTSIKPTLGLEGTTEILNDYMREGVGVSFALASVENRYEGIKFIKIKDDIPYARIYISRNRECHISNSIIAFQEFMKALGDRKI